jgi:hypothetical protein
VFLPAVVVLYRRPASRAGAALLALTATGVAVACVAGALGTGDELLAGILLAAYGALAYTASFVVDRMALVTAAGALAAAGGVLIATAGGVALVALPLVSLGVAWAFALLGLVLPIPARRRREHRIAAIAVAAVTAVVCAASPAFTTLGSSDAWMGALATASVALLLALQTFCEPLPATGYAAALTGSLVSCWVVLALGATRPELYASLPAIALIGCALTERQKRSLELDNAVIRGALALGVIVLLGIPGLEALAGGSDSSVSLLVLVCAAVACIVTGVGAHDRTLVVGGAAALLGAAGKAVFLAVEQIPLYVVFGCAALLLLGVAGLLAAARDRLVWARGSAAQAWSEWS